MASFIIWLLSFTERGPLPIGYKIGWVAAAAVESNRGLLVVSRGHFSDNDCVSVASRAVEGRSTRCVPRSLFR